MRSGGSGLFRRSDALFSVTVDTGCLAATLAVCALNRRFAGVFTGPFMRGHFNDLMAGILFPAYVNLVLSLFGMRMRSWLEPLLFTLVAGIFWEYVTPLYRPQSVSDVWDIVAYLVGTLNYCALTRWLMSLRRNANGTREA